MKKKTKLEFKIKIIEIEFEKKITLNLKRKITVIEFGK